MGIDFIKYDEFHYPLKKQIYRNPLFEKVYNYIMETYKSERDVFTLEDIVHQFKNLLWDENEYYYTDKVSAQRNSIKCIEEVLEYLSKTRKIRIINKEESGIVHYAPTYSIQDKELHQVDGR